MMKHDNDEGHVVKIEAGQIENPECFPRPSELVCIQVPKVFDQVAVRDCVTVTVKLESHESHPKFTFEGASDFDIVEVKVISKTDSLVKPGFKKLKVFVKIKFIVFFSDGEHQSKEKAEATFTLTVNEIFCPDCLTQIGVVRFPKTKHKTIDEDGDIIKIEAITEAFNDMINPCTGILTLDVGAFFIVKCECEVQLLIPAFGYCPVPPEERNPSTQNCHTFNDKSKTPFPRKFFPDQKFNPLDRRERERDVDRDCDKE